MPTHQPQSLIPPDFQKILKKIKKPIDKPPAAAVNILKETRDGVSPSGKAAGFGPAIPRFESLHPS